MLNIHVHEHTYANHAYLYIYANRVYPYTYAKHAYVNMHIQIHMLNIHTQIRMLKMHIHIHMLSTQIRCIWDKFSLHPMHGGCPSPPSANNDIDRSIMSPASATAADAAAAAAADRDIVMKSHLSFDPKTPQQLYCAVLCHRILSSPYVYIYIYLTCINIRRYAI